MVIGNGLLAQMFFSYARNENIIIFASGVSNSQETQATEFAREQNLLLEIINKHPDKTLVYFSTCSIYDPSAKDNLYVKHKKAMEDIILKSVKHYYIFRLSHVVGKTNSPTIINYLQQKINNNEPFELWADSSRNLIHSQDVFKIVDYILTHDLYVNEIINIASPDNVSIQKIVQMLEEILKKKAHFTLVQKGAKYDIDISLIKTIAPKAGVFFNENYMRSVLENNCKLMPEEYKIVKVPGIIDPRGGLSFVELGVNLDFLVKRVYWLYDIKENRGGHAHKELKQFIFCVHGAVEFILDNGVERQSVILNAPNQGLLITKPLWREIVNFQNDPQVIVLASEIYKEDDYLRTYEEFKQWLSHSI